MITIFENGKYILHLPDWANNVYLKLEELPYKGCLCILEISYRDKKAYCLYHPTIKRHTLWVDSVEELDKRYAEGEINPLRGIVVYGTDMWGDPIPIKIYLEEDDNFRNPRSCWPAHQRSCWRTHRCEVLCMRPDTTVEVNGKLKYIDFLSSIFKRLRKDYPLVNWDFVHYKDKFVNWV